MSRQDNSEGKCDSKYDDEEITDVGEKMTPPKIEILSINFEPAMGPLSGPLELNIKFELDRDVVAGYWIIRFLVDSSDRRLIKVSHRIRKLQGYDCRVSHRYFIGIGIMGTMTPHQP